MRRSTSLGLLFLVAACLPIGARAEDEAAPTSSTRIAEVDVGPANGPLPRIAFDARGRWLLVDRKLMPAREGGGDDDPGGLLVLRADTGAIHLRVADRDLHLPRTTVFHGEHVVGLRPADVEVEGGVLQVHECTLHALADGKVSRHRLAGLDRHADVRPVAVDARGRWLGVEVSSGEGGRTVELLVYELVAEDDAEQPVEPRHRFARLSSRTFGGGDPGVRIVGDRLVYHHRPRTGVERAGAAGRRLVVVDLATGAVREQATCWVSTATAGFSISPDGELLYNGGSDFVVRVHPLRGDVAPSVLFDGRAELYSHFLELTLAMDGGRLAAWSRERPRIWLADVPEGPARAIDLGEKAGTIAALDREGRLAWTVRQREGTYRLALRDLDAGGRVVLTLLPVAEAEALRVSPDGTRLAWIGRGAKGRRMLRLETLPLP